VTIPISIDNNLNSRSVQSTENDECEMADLIAEGTILAILRTAKVSLFDFVETT
jgi:hypothetical protein